MSQHISNRRFTYTLALLAGLLPVLLFSCQKTKVEPAEVYPDPPTALVKFLDTAPAPAIGSEGTIVTISVEGLKGKEGQFKFYINQTEAEVIAVAESTIKVKVPFNASTGAVSVLINGENYFGPTFTVKGKVSIDPSFNTESFRTNGPIVGIFKRSDNSSYLIFGGFSDYQNQATPTNKITGIAVVDLNGAYMPVASQLKMRTQGINGMVSSVVQLPDGKYLVAGSFSKYDTIGNINNITRLNADGVLDSSIVDVVNPDPVNNPNGGKAIVPTFNGGTLGAIGEVFYNASTGITAFGNFNGHISTFYERSTQSGPYLDLVQARQVIRMKETGSFDSSYNFNRATNQGYEAANGFLFDAIQLPGGDLIVVGNFTRFNNVASGYIARIKTADGLPDPAFNSGGAGANGAISRVTYNPANGKLLLTGSFTSYNGQPANGVVMINANGSIDASFNFKTVEGGVANYAGQLSNGKIIVSGTFNKYNGIVRPGFIILNADGTMAPGYNNMGLFRGSIAGFTEYTSITGIGGLVLVGTFDRFDGKTVGNIVKMRMEN